MTWVVAARCDVQKCDQNATISAGGGVITLETSTNSEISLGRGVHREYA